MTGFRNILFQVHLWVGLGLGLLFVALGLSGSVLVYPEIFQGSRQAAPAATARGEILPLEQIIAAARGAASPNANAAATVTLPREGEAASVRFASGRGGAAGRGGRGGPQGPETFVDPVSGAVLGTRTQQPSLVFGIAHEMHETMMLEQGGRALVGWLGFGMLFLGLSGIYLWWPRGTQWKYAFMIRSSARGVRLYREIHGAFGIWFLIVFVVVTVTGIPLAFPGLMGGPGGERPPGLAQAAAPQTITVPDGVARQPLAALVAAAEDKAGAKVRAITVPAQPDRPLTVTLASDMPGPAPTATVNPYTAEAAIAAGPRPQQPTGLSFRTLHAGNGLGAVWKLLVFASGFLPLLFVVTGFLMWWKKRKARAGAAAARAA